MSLLGKFGPTARVALFWRLLTNKNTPWWGKIGFIATSIGYMFSPLNFISSIPLVGWIDDLLILPAFAWVFGTLLPGIAGWDVWDVFHKNTPD